MFYAAATPSEVFRTFLSNLSIAIIIRGFRRSPKMQRSQRKRCAPSWLKEKPYIKVRFTQDGMITKVLESWKIKLSEGGKHLVGSLANFSFRVDQKVWCYWKTVDEKEKCYFEGKIIEIWDDSVGTAEIEADDHEDQTISETNDFEPLEEIEGKEMTQLYKGYQEVS